jgi:hypothetical protein
MAQFTAGPVAPLLDPLSVQAPTISFFHLLNAREIVSRRASVVGGLLFDCPADMRDAFLAFSQREVSVQVRTWPGFVLRRFYEDIDEPTRFLAIHGWEAEAAHRVARREMAAAFDARRRELGVRAQQFSAVPRGELESSRIPETTQN